MPSPLAPDTPMLTRKEIEARAQAILQQANAATLCINPVSLASAQGITIYNAEFAKSSLSDMITKQGNDSLFW